MRLMAKHITTLHPAALDDPIGIRSSDILQAALMRGEGDLTHRVQKSVLSLNAPQNMG